MADLIDGYLTFASIADWDTWLEANHRHATEAWVAFPKQGNTTPSPTRAQAVVSALKFGWIDGQALSRDLPDGWWAQRFTPRRPTSRWSLLNRQAAEKLIARGQMRPAGLEQVHRAQQDGRWDAAYPPPSVATIPPDLNQALDARPGRRQLFEALPARERYRIINHLHTARRPDIRARRLHQHLQALDNASTQP